MLVLVLLALMELSFRAIGQKPNSKGIWFSNIQDVDSLVVYENFIADSFGIIRANPKWKWGDSIEVNSLGFRTTESECFLQVSQKDRILLIGDSFAWGIGANPITNCFSDLLQRNTEFEIFNTGIPTAGPNQYMWIAEYFIPKLKPKKVIVAFYMGNDLFPNEVFLKPYSKNYHFTNVGPIQAWVDGKYAANAKEALNLHLRNSRNSNLIKREFGGFIDYMIKKTVLGTKLLNAYVSIKSNIACNKVGYAYLNYISKIKEIAVANNCDFKLFIIPYRSKRVDTNLFKGLDPLVPNNLTTKSYHLPPDDHFNNQGHFDFYKFITNNLKD